MLIGMAIILAFFIGLVVVKGTRKYRDDSNKAGQRDRKDWISMRNEANNKNKKY